ncbi:MAG: histidine phosphatase family protein [Clostridia bacterium]|nr:histidine phosphatase family protein [Clostridia bacterium]
MKVYLLRHGETVGNVKGTFAGNTDTPLTEFGIEQGKLAYNKLKDVDIDVVISSPLSRAVDTANLVISHPLILDERLKEMHFGLFENMTYQEICEHYPDQIITWQNEGLYYTFPEGESVKSFYDRVIEGYLNILETHREKNILIVAHSGVIRSILAHEISEKFEHYWKYKIDNCGLAIIEYHKGYTILSGSNL